MRARSPVVNFIFVLIDNVYASEADKGATTKIAKYKVDHGARWN